jgi:hypothetical protein
MLKKWLGGFLALCLLITGCNMQSRTRADVHSDLLARLADVRQAQIAALSLWDRVIFGEIVSCQDAIAVPQPIDLPRYDLNLYAPAKAVQGDLNAAIQAVRDSSDLWDMECADPRTVVSLGMAAQGRSAALAAGASLAQASDLLTQ